MAWTPIGQITGIERDDDIAAYTNQTASTQTCDTTYTALGSDRCMKIPLGTSASGARSAFANLDAFSVNAIYMFSLDVGGGATTSGAGIISQNVAGGFRFVRLNNSPRVLDIYDSSGTKWLSSTSTWSTSALTRFWVMFDCTDTNNTKLAIWNYKGDIEAYRATGVARSTFFGGAGITMRFGELLPAATNRGADIFGGVIGEYSTSAGDSPLWTPYPRLQVAGGGGLPPTAVGGLDDSVTLTSGTATAATTGPPGTLTDGGASWTVNLYAGTTVKAGGKTMAILSNTATVLTGAQAWSGGGNPGAVAYTIQGGWNGTMTSDTLANKWKNLGATKDLGSPGAHPGHDSDTSFCGTASANDTYGLRQTFTYSAANPLSSIHTVRFAELGATFRVTAGGKGGVNGMIYDGTNQQIITYAQPGTSYAGSKATFTTNAAGTALAYTDFDLSGGVGVTQFGGRGLTSAETGAGTVGSRVTAMPGPSIVFFTKGQYLKTWNARPIYIN